MSSSNTSQERIILVNEHDQEIGLEEKLAAHQQNLLHRAFSVFIFRETPRRELLLQQRALGKYHSGGLWTNTCCSHPRSGEDVIAAGERRLLEEFGIKATLKSLGWFHYNAHFENGLSENEIDHVLIGTVAENAPMNTDPKEIHAFRWVTVEALRAEMTKQPDKFTPWLRQALDIVSPSP